ncbi:MAG: PIG-L family deacetylase [Acidimicrobiales bacterium]
MPEFRPVSPVMIVSPHLDDAVLSCGHFLYRNPSTSVVTILAGAPVEMHEGYNSKTTGKRYAPDAIALRRAEDQSAMDFAGATPIWLDLLDADYSEYREHDDYVEIIREALDRVLGSSDAKSVVAPLGLIHADHRAVSEACLQLAVDSNLAWYLYMDLPYGFSIRRAVSKRLRDIKRRFPLEEFVAYEGDTAVKRSMMNLYESQYAPTMLSNRRGFEATMTGSERYWRIVGLRSPA